MNRADRRRAIVRERGRRLCDGLFRRTGLRRRYRPKGVRCPIVLYHGVTDEPGPWDVTPSQFRRHVDWLSGTFDLLPISRAIERWRNGTLPARPAVITFDDGLASTLEHALPVLDEYGIAATHYVIPGLLGERFESKPVMTRDDVVGLYDQGQEIGAHSMTHPDLTVLSESRLRAEFVESRRALAALVDDPPRSFAYPSGAFDRRVASAAAEAGFETATTVVASDVVDFARPFSIPRITVMRTHDLETLGSLVSGSRRWQRVVS